MAVIYIALLIGGLIFFHELGHFLVARALGVHVVTFSIGFGPEVAAFDGRSSGGRPPTRYMIGALPLGGYVMMLGSDMADGDVPRELEPWAFSSKPVWRRILIIAAGPVFNFILAGLILFGTGLAVDRVLPSVAATVMTNGGAAKAGMRSGDRIVAINDAPVEYFWQVQDAMASHDGGSVKLSVDRRGRHHDLVVEPHVDETEIPEVGVTHRKWLLGIAASYARPIISVDPASAAASAGLQTGDLVLSLGGEPVQRYDQVEAILAEGAERSLEVVAVRPKTRPTAGLELGVGDTIVAALPPATVADADRGVGSAQFVVRTVVPGTPAAALGLQPGDRITKLDGRGFALWGNLYGQMHRARDEKKTLTWERDGEVHTATFELAEVPWPMSLRKEATRYVFGVRTWSQTGHLDLVDNDTRLAFAFYNAHSTVGQLIDQQLQSIRGLVFGSVPLTELGGPILIGQLAAKTSDLGWGYFLQLMAFISIGLGVINLLPIPVLDGGQLLFLIIEGIRRQPVSLRTRQIAVYLGLAFLLVIMVIVFKQDIERAFFS